MGDFRAKRETTTGLLTHSERKLQEALAKHGKDLAWFKQKSAEQQDLCAECGHPEKSRLPNGTYRSLSVNYDLDVLICTKCASKKRSATARERAAAIKEKAEQQIKDAEPKSFQDFWQRNRAELDPAELARLEARHDAVELLYTAIVDYNNGTDGTTEEERADTVVEVIQELKQHGTVDHDLIAIPFYLPREVDFYNAVLAADVPGAGKHAKANAIFVRTGFLTALPIFLYDNQVRIFLQRFGPKPVEKPITLACACGAKVQMPEHEAMTRFGTLDNPANYAVRYRCASCQQREAAALSRFQERTKVIEKAEQARNTVFDAYGRVKDQPS